MKLTEDQIHQLDKLQDAGAYIQAYKQLVGWGDLHTLEDAESRTMAGRVLSNVGAERIGRQLYIRAYRDEPKNPTAIYFFSRALLNRRGPWPALQFFQSHTEMKDAPAAIRADWLAAYGSTLAIFRDFDRAMDLLDHAIALCPSEPWLYVEKAYVLQQQDRYDEALTIVSQAQNLRPLYRPVVQHTAYLLTLMGRDQEALELLNRACAAMESFAVLTQLIYLQQELGLYADARSNLKRVPDLYPVMERRTKEWFASATADAEYYCGDHAAAIETGKSVPAKHPLRPILARIEQNLGIGKRVKLDVPFTRQHHVTCVPATLATLTRYLGKPADHLKIAETICYDGTPPSAERTWAIENGYKAREFTLTWDSARALIDRGLPFMFFTVEPGHGHAQAIIGYDTFRGTLLVRDPYYRNVVEFDAEATLKKYCSSGPRAMVIVPEERAEELENLPLPESEYYDELFAVQRALEKHHREEAAAAVQRLEEAAPQHRMTIYAQRAVAIYDTNRPAILAATEALLKIYPDDGNLLLSKFYSLNDLGTREDRLTLLQQAWRHHSHPIFATHIVSELSADARELPMMRHMIKRAIRSAPTAAASYRSLANIYWMRCEFADACGIYRLAATLDDKNESHAWAYFQSTHPVKQTSEGIRFLERRAESLSRYSTAPIKTLVDAYDSLDQHPKAFDLLEKAIKDHDNDPDLLLYAACRYTAYNQYERGHQLLARAREKAYPLAWLYSAAEMASFRADHNEALSLWREVATRDPLNMNAHRAIARLLASTQSPNAAQNYLRELSERFPYHGEIMELRVVWMRDEDPAVVEPLIRQLLAMAPQNAWAHRELALCLSQQSRHQEALESAQVSEALEPTSAATFNTLISLARARGDKAEHRTLCQRALQISADNDFAIQAILRSSDNEAEKRDALDLIHRELVRQVITGDGLLAYRTAAEAVLPREDVLAHLKDAHHIRPDLWHCWVALAQQQVYCNQPGEALKTMASACERFPLLPIVWIERSRVERHLNQRQAQIESILQALRINPSWSYASRELAEAYQDINNVDAARDALHTAISRSPLDAANYVFLADVLAKQNQHDQAIAQIEKAIRLDPDVEDWWHRLKGYCEKIGKPELALEKIRDLARRNAGDAHAWLTLAGLLTEFEHLDEAINAANHVLELNPHSIDARDQLAYLLTTHHRYEEAMAACGRADSMNNLPVRLQSRIAWIHAQKGNTDRAIELMKQVLQQDQSNFNGWRWLAEWQNNSKQWDAYLETSKKMVALWPTWTDALEHLASAQWMINKADARITLERIIELAPSSSFAPAALAELQMESGEYDAALITLEYFKKQNNIPEYLRRKIWIELRQKKIDGAAETFKELCCIAYTPKDTLQAEYKRCFEAGMQEDVLRHCMNHAISANGAPFCGALLIRLEVDQHRWSQAISALKAMEDKDAFWQCAMKELLCDLGKKKNKTLLADVYLQYGARISNTVHLWGSLGYAYSEIEDYDRVIEIMQDYRRFKNPPGWALLNLARAYRRKDMMDRAEETLQFAIKQEPDHAYTGIQIWLAEAVFCRGDFRQCAILMEQINRQQLNNFQMKLMEILQLGCNVCCRENTVRIGELMRRLNKLYPSNWRKEPFVSKLVWRNVRRQIFKNGVWYSRIIMAWYSLSYY